MRTLLVASISFGLHQVHTQNVSAPYTLSNGNDAPSSAQDETDQTGSTGTSEQLIASLVSGLGVGLSLSTTGTSSSESVASAL